MRKLLIVCYYELKDYLQTIASLFVDKYIWDVMHYPLYMYCYDKYSKIDDYAEHFNNTIKKEKPDVILWWFTDIPLSVFTKIKKDNPKIFYVMYNVNDPMNINKIFFDKCKIFDTVMTPCKHNMYMYNTHGCVKDVKFFPMGADPHMFKRYTQDEMDMMNPTKSSSEKKFTVSFICESLYSDYKDQLVPRKTIIQTIDTLCKKNNWLFNLYGSEFLKPSYPEIYRGDPEYLDKPIIFNTSHINIVSHPIKNKFVAIDPIVVQIMSCGGLILMDMTYGIDDYFNKNNQCIMMFNNVESLESQIISIKDMYTDSPETVDIIKQNCVRFSDKYTWDKFVDTIYFEYCKQRFDPVFYSKIYSLQDSDPESLYRLWLLKYNQGVKEICFAINVPQTFDHTNYKEKYNIESDSLEFLYIDWWFRGKNMDYIVRSKNTNNMISGSQMNMLTQHLFNLYEAFNCAGSSVPDVKLSGIKKIESIVKKNPRLSINVALRQYIEISHTE
jgi:hypothetical protein